MMTLMTIIQFSREPVNILSFEMLNNHYYRVQSWSRSYVGAAFLLAHRHIYIGSYMSAHVLLNSLNEYRKRDKMRGLPSILSLFRNEFNKFNNTRARMLDSIYHMTLRLL